MHRASDIGELDRWPDPPMIHVATVKKALRLAWRRKFGDICQSCGTHMHFDIKFRSHRSYATIDHILARGLGGSNKLGNIQIICRACNNVKSVDEHRQKLD